MAAGRFGFYVGQPEREGDDPEGVNLSDDSSEGDNGDNETNPGPNTQQDVNVEEGVAETQAQKRHRESHEAKRPRGKRQKLSGAGGLDQVGKGVLAMVDAIREDTEAFRPKDDTLAPAAASSPEDQALEKIQSEACLTKRGQIVMANRVMDTRTAKTYLAWKDEEVRTLWLQDQLETHIHDKGSGTLNDLFIEKE